MKEEPSDGRETRRRRFPLAFVMTFIACGSLVYFSLKLQRTYEMIRAGDMYMHHARAFLSLFERALPEEGDANEEGSGQETVSLRHTTVTEGNKATLAITFISEGREQFTVTFSGPRNKVKEYREVGNALDREMPKLKQTLQSPKFLYGDVLVGSLLILPLSVLVTVILFLLCREKANLANVVTVFAGVVGILSLFYFLWRLE